MEQHLDAGPVVGVPGVLLDELVRLASKALVFEARTNGVTPAPGIARLLGELDALRRAVHTGQSADGGHPPVDEVSAAEAALALGISKRRVLQRIGAGTLPARRVGGRWLIERAVLPDREAA